MALTVGAELKANFQAFKASAKTETEKVSSSIAVSDAIFLSSYGLVCSFRGWHEVALNSLPDEVIGFL
jgi:hypothetical protein